MNNEILIKMIDGVLANHEKADFKDYHHLPFSAHTALRKCREKLIPPCTVPAPTLSELTDEYKKSGVLIKTWCLCQPMNWSC